MVNLSYSQCGTRLVYVPADIMGRIPLVRLGLVKYVRLELKP